MRQWIQSLRIPEVETKRPAPKRAFFVVDILVVEILAGHVSLLGRLLFPASDFSAEHVLKPYGSGRRP